MTVTRPAPSTQRAARAAAGAIIAAFAALALAYNAVVPPFEGADESSHYFFAKHLYCTGTLPVQQARAEDRGLWEQEGSQPPLYYALVSPLVRLDGNGFDPAGETFRGHCEPGWDALTYNHQNSMGRPEVRGNENRFVASASRRDDRYLAAVRAMRLASTLLALATLVALWSIFARVLAPRRWLAVAALALVGLNPQFIHLSSTVSNDNAMNAVAAVSLALLLRVVGARDDDVGGGGDGDGGGDGPSIGAASGRARARRRDAAALAVSVGLAPLAKLSGLALAAFVVGALLWAAWRRRGAGAAADARRLVATAAAVVAACVVLAGWWYLRNLRLYGSLTGLNLMLPPELQRDVSAARFVRGLPAELYGLWLSSWGVFGWFTILLPRWVYALVDAAALAALAGGVRAWGRRAWRRPSWPRPDIALLVVWWLVAFAALLRWMLIAKGAHGRLLFPAVAAPAVLLVLGWRALLPPRRLGDGALAAIVAVAMAGLSAGALLGAIRPAYARPRFIVERTLPPDAVPVGVAFDGTHARVELAAIRAPARVVEGRNVDVTLYWRILDHPTSEFDGPLRDGYVALRWDQAVAAADDPTALRTVASPPDLSYPGRGNAPFATLDRSAGLLVEDVRTIRAPALATRPDWDGYRPSTLARLVVDIYDMNAQESWPSAPAAPGGPDSAAVDVAIDAAAPQPRRDEARMAAAGPPSARFGDAIALDVRAFDAAGVPQRPALPLALDMNAPAASGTLDLVWRALQAPGEDLQLFVHVTRDGEAEPLALDGPPSRDHRYPTSRWRPGDRIPSRVAWAWPSPVRPGDRLTVRLGLYRPTDGTPRLPAVDAAGARWSDDAVTVGTVTVR